jgi:chaperonin GroES
MHIRPLSDRLIVRRLDEDEQTIGAMIIPDAAREKPQQGEVIAAGPPARNRQAPAALSPARRERPLDRAAPGG